MDNFNPWRKWRPKTPAQVRPLHVLRKLYFALIEPHDHLVEKCVEFAKEYWKTGRAKLVFEVTIKFIYGQNIIYLYGMVKVLDYYFNKICPVKVDEIS